MRKLILLWTLTALVLPTAAVAQAPAYEIPADNPFVSTAGARGEVYVYGLRNPFRWSFDRRTGDMIVGDVGSNRKEEITLLPSATIAGANLGWNCFEGSEVADGDCDPPDARPPTFEYDSDSNVVIGGYVVRDRSLRSFAGRYLFGDTYTGEIQALDLAGASAPVDAGANVESIVAFGEDGVGHLHAVSLSGPVYRLGESGGSLTTTSVGTFDAPTAVAGLPRRAKRLLVAEREGRVKLLLGGVAHDFLDITDAVSTSGERGLLAIAAAPDYARSGKLYLFYTDNDGDLRLDEVSRSAADRKRADPATRRTLLTIEHSSEDNHNGGQLLFGADGYLYLSTGDGGGQGDPGDDAQSLASLLGKVLRIDVHAAPGPPPWRDAPPRVRARLPGAQRLLRTGGAVAFARCSERCRLTASGSLEVGGRSYALRRAARLTDGGRRVRLRLGLTKRGAKALRGSLRRRGGVSLRVAIRARDARGNRSRLVRKTLRVKRRKASRSKPRARPRSPASILP